MSEPSLPSADRLKVDRQAVGVALLSYTAWGLFPIYWRWLQGFAATELLAHRFLWSFAFYVGVYALFRRRRAAASRTQDHVPTLADWGSSLLAVLFLAVNWGVYIYAVNAGRVLESSLAYFLNPILNVAVGVVFFREAFPPALRIAVLLAALGVGTQFVGSSEFPWIAVVLACTFCGYGIVKKRMPVEATLGSLMEGAVGVLPALAAVVYLRQQSPVAEPTALQWMLLVGTGVITGLPLVLFSYSAQRLPYTLLGVMQFVAPTLQFLVGWLMFHETLGPSRLIAFALVWAGIGFYLVDRLVRLWTLQATPAFQPEAAESTQLVTARSGRREPGICQNECEQEAAKVA